MPTTGIPDSERKRAKPIKHDAARRREQIAQASLRFRARRAADEEAQRAENARLKADIARLSLELAALREASGGDESRLEGPSADTTTTAADDDDAKLLGENQVLKLLLVEHHLFLKFLEGLNAPLSLGAGFVQVNRASATELLDDCKFQCLRLLAQFDFMDSRELSLVELPSGLNARLRFSYDAEQQTAVLRMDVTSDLAAVTAAAAMDNLVHGLMDPSRAGLLSPPEISARMANSTWSQWSSPLEAAEGTLRAVHRVDLTDAAETLHLAAETVEDRALCTLVRATANGARQQQLRHGTVLCHTLCRMGATRCMPQQLRNEVDASRPSRFSSIQGFYVWNDPAVSSTVHSVIVARVPIEFPAAAAALQDANAVDDMVTGSKREPCHYWGQIGYLVSGMFATSNP